MAKFQHNYPLKLFRNSFSTSQNTVAKHTRPQVYQFSELHKMDEVNAVNTQTALTIATRSVKYRVQFIEQRKKYFQNHEHNDDDITSLNHWLPPYQLIKMGFPICNHVWKHISTLLDKYSIALDTSYHEQYNMIFNKKNDHNEHSIIHQHQHEHQQLRQTIDHFSEEYFWILYDKIQQGKQDAFNFFILREPNLIGFNDGTFYAKAFQEYQNDLHSSNFSFKSLDIECIELDSSINNAQWRYTWKLNV